jgi:hypothetical protein
MSSGLGKLAKGNRLLPTLGVIRRKGKFVSQNWLDDAEHNQEKIRAKRSPSCTGAPNDQSDKFFSPGTLNASLYNIGISGTAGRSQ